MVIRSLNTLVRGLVLAIIFLLLLHNTTYAINYNDFNQNVKNYNQNLSIIDKNGSELVKYKVAVAKNQEEKSYGLMNLRYLSNEKGMLFLFKKHAIINMWMKNTLIPLDMIFIRGNEIVWIVENTTPLSLKYISSKFEIDKVLEVNAGEVEKWGIEIGDGMSF
mgnify:FL=1